jgi:hypothetical protein
MGEQKLADSATAHVGVGFIITHSRRYFLFDPNLCI